MHPSSQPDRHACMQAHATTCGTWIYITYVNTTDMTPWHTQDRLDTLQTLHKFLCYKAYMYRLHCIHNIHVHCSRHMRNLTLQYVSAQYMLVHHTTAQYATSPDVRFTLPLHYRLLPSVALCCIALQCTCFDIVWHARCPCHDQYHHHYRTMALHKTGGACCQELVQSW